MNKKLVIALAKRKLFKRAGGGLNILKAVSPPRRSYSLSVAPPKQEYKKLTNGLKNLSIKPLKFKF